MASNLKQQPQPPSSPSPSSSSSSHLQSLSLPFKTRVALKLLDLATDAVRRSNGTVNRPIFNFLDRRVPANPTPLNSVSSHDVIVDPSSNLWFRLFLPHPAAADGGAAGTPIPVIVFFHGGGFVFLSASSFAYDAVCRRLSRRLNAVVCSVEYRLAPEHKFPTQYEDGLAVLKFLDTRRGEIPVWPANAAVSRCFIAGDSAGGNISHHVTVSACTPTSGLTELKVIGLINIQPFFGGLNRVASETDLEGAPIVSAARTAWMWSAFLPEELDADHWAVNVSGPNAVDLKTVEFPETLLFIGGFDPLKDWQRRYYEWLTTSEGKVVKLVEYSNAIHAFYVFPELPQANLLFVEVQEFVRNTLSKL